MSMKKQEKQTKSLIHDLIDELNKDDIPEKLLKPHIDKATDLLKPYYIFHVTMQIIIIILLLFIIYTIYSTPYHTKN